MDNRTFLETWYRRVWFEEDLSAIDDMMAPKAPVNGIDKTQRIGPEDFKTFTATLLKLICDTNIVMEEFIEDGERVSVLMNISANCRKTGTPLNFSGIAMGQIKDGKILYAHNYIDFITMFEQLGQLPDATLAQCLSGHRLT